MGDAEPDAPRPEPWEGSPGINFPPPELKKDGNPMCLEVSRSPHHKK